LEPIIQLDHVTKEFKILNRHEGLKGSIQDLFSRDYRLFTAVDDVSLRIGPGEMVGYLGPNGAGKSTTIKMMTGVLNPSAGQIMVNGMIPYQERARSAHRIGVVFGQRTQLWWSLPAIESFKLLKDIYRVSDKTYKDNLEFYDSIVGASNLYHKTIREMSLGQRTLCDILAAFLHNPSVVFLDEPTIGLDVSMKSKIRQLVLALNQERGTTVILTTHDMGDVDALCNRIVIIDHGRRLYDDSIEQLRKFFGDYRTVRMKFSKHSEEQDLKKLEELAENIMQLLSEKFPGKECINVEVVESWIDILLKEEQVHMMEIINCIQQQYPIMDMSMQEISTESVIKKIYEGKIN